MPRYREGGGRRKSHTATAGLPTIESYGPHNPFTPSSADASSARIEGARTTFRRTHRSCRRTVVARRVMGADVTDPPSALDRLDDLAHVVDVPRLGLMVDFDGTLAPIAPTPDEAVISPAALDALQRIVPAIEMVCVVSGRALADLTAKVDLPGATFVGNHGVEFFDGSDLRSSPESPITERPSRACWSISGRGSTTRQSCGRESRWARQCTSGSHPTRRASRGDSRPLWPTRPASTGSSRSGARWYWSSSPRWGWTRATPSGSSRASGSWTRCCSSATTRPTRPGWRPCGSTDRRADCAAQPSPSFTTTRRRPYCAPRTTRSRASPASSGSWPGSPTGSRTPG